MEVDVRKQSSEQRNQSLERSRHGGSLERRGVYPSPFSLNPAEFFSASPFSLMRRFTEEMDRMFEGFGGWRGGTKVTQWSPAIEVNERDGKLEVLAELPGLKESDVKVEVTGEGLVIQGERKREHEEKREGYYRSERSYGQFYRLIPLPEGANVDQAHAEFHNGELRVSIPVPEQKTRQIPISTTGERKEAQSQTAAAASAARRAG
ncbi:MAG: Hsp20/alpha crystallin family protein [Acidobacteriia bacterium]|nr:Hsp20/alpha crystallin family protein [Terriglobia bacterium]